MSRYRISLLVLLVVYGGFGLTIAWFGMRVPPYVGDLTRLGGYSEVDYGWRAPQQRYQPALYRQAASYPAGIEVLVLGDSMSLHNAGEQTDPGVYWPNHLAKASGWKIAALHRAEWLLDDLMQDPQFQAAPPRVFILEFAERAITALGRITAGADPTACQGVPHDPQPLPLEPLVPRSGVWSPPSTSIAGVDFSLGANHLKRKLLNALHPGWNETLHFDLDRGGLFSSRADRSLLVYADDLRKVDATAEQIERQRCALLSIQNQMHAAGVGYFMVLVVPDKLSTYRRQVVDLPAGYPEIIAKLARDPALNLPRLDLAFDRAVDAGTPDLFLPNDTHPGVAGHKAIAESVLRHLVAAGVVAE